ncbi:MAG: toll/interleukin-1 receptor domain-containing protein [Limisphaerales bacterium]
MSTTNLNSVAVFISHSGKDEKLAEALVELLRNALNIPANAIRCTSVNGYRLPAGAPTDEALRREVHESKAFIGLITPSSMESAYVMFELGARWGAGLHLVPLLGAGAGASFLRGPLGSLNALNCENAAQVHQLVDDLGKLLDLKERTPTAAYQAYVDRLIGASKSSGPAIAEDASEPEYDPAAQGKAPDLSERAKKLLLEVESCEISTPKGLSILRVAATEGDYLPHLYNAKPPSHVRCIDLNEVIEAVDDLVEAGWLRFHASEGSVTEYRRTSRSIPL